MDAEKTPLQHRVLGLLVQAAREAGGGRFRYSHARLAADLGGCSLSLFPRVMRALEGRGLIRRHRLSRGYELEVIDHQEGDEGDVIDHPLGLVIDHQGAAEVDVIDHHPAEQVARGGSAQQDAPNRPESAEGVVIDHIGGLHGTHVCCDSNSSSSMRARESDLPGLPEQPPAGCPNPALWLAARLHLNAARSVADAIAWSCPERSVDELLLALAHAGRRPRADNPAGVVRAVWSRGERLIEELPQAQQPAPVAPPSRPAVAQQPGRATPVAPPAPQSDIEAEARVRRERVARLTGGAALSIPERAAVAREMDRGASDEQVLAALAQVRAAQTAGVGAA